MPLNQPIMRAVVVLEATGSPNALDIRYTPPPEPQEEQVPVRVEALPKSNVSAEEVRRFSTARPPAEGWSRPVEDGRSRTLWRQSVTWSRAVCSANER